MKRAFVFPGQGAQFVGMGKELYDSVPKAREMFDLADRILGFKITELMFAGSDEDLRKTSVTQPAVFLHSVILAECLGAEFNPDMVAGHSLGEFSALVAAKALDFEDGLRLVSKRAEAMQKACDLCESTMAAVIGLPGQVVEQVCSQVDGIVVPANYNCPGQLVISGSVAAVNVACERLKEAGAKRALQLKVNGAFHSPLMNPAREELRQAIDQVEFHTPLCPVYQNVDAAPHSLPAEIKSNLIAQLDSPVLWTQIVQHMVADGAQSFVELGPGAVLQGLVKKIAPEITDLQSLQTL